MKISLVVAASTNDVIGKDGGLPWHIPEDLKRFKAITMGKPIVMGRLTHESIGRALPGRQNIVITTRKGYTVDGCDVVACPADALRAAGDADEVMVIGGGEIYRQFLRRADRIYLTRVDADIDGDVFFPTLAPAEWAVVDEEECPANAERDLGYRFQVLDRIDSGGARQQR